MESLSGPQQKEVIRNELRGLEDWKNLGKTSGVAGVRAVIGTLQIKADRWQLIVWVLNNQKVQLTQSKGLPPGRGAWPPLFPAPLILPLSLLPSTPRLPPG